MALVFIEARKRPVNSRKAIIVNVDSCFLTFTGLAGVFVQLSKLPVQVGVPGLQLKVVKWLDVEVWPLNLQVRVGLVNIWFISKQRTHLISFSVLSFSRLLNGLFKEVMMEEINN